MLRVFLIAASFVTLSFSSAIAEGMKAPEGEVLLTITGNVEMSNVDNSMQLDLALLEEFDVTTIETSTIWTEGLQMFQGVSLETLVRELGITGTTLQATAINDYAVEIPMSDAVEGGAIVAYRLNGKTMSVREKGPLWIVYPYDSDTKYRTEVIFSRSIWQLDRIQALD